MYQQSVVQIHHVPPSRRTPSPSPLGQGAPLPPLPPPPRARHSSLPSSPRRTPPSAGNHTPPPLRPRYASPLLCPRCPPPLLPHPLCPHPLCPPPLCPHPLCPHRCVPPRYRRCPCAAPAPGAPRACARSVHYGRPQTPRGAVCMSPCVRSPPIWPGVRSAAAEAAAAMAACACARAYSFPGGGGVGAKCVACGAPGTAEVGWRQAPRQVRAAPRRPRRAWCRRHPLAGLVRRRVRGEG